MSYGRIKRDRYKRGSAFWRDRNIGGRKVNIVVTIFRTAKLLDHPGKYAHRYGAHACLRTGRNATRRCGPSGFARTPQNAIAKALKAFSSTIARRGRR